MDGGWGTPARADAWAASGRAALSLPRGVEHHPAAALAARDVKRHQPAGGPFNFPLQRNAPKHIMHRNAPKLRGRDMGRPPIGKRAMSNTERSRRRRQRLRDGATKPATKPSAADADEIVALKTRIGELEAEVARLMTENTRLRRISPTTPSVAARARPARDDAPASPNRLRKFIRMLSSSTDQDVLNSAHALDRGLRAIGKDLHALADLTKQWDAEITKQHPPKPKPIHWPDVEAVITKFVDGKTKIRTNDVLRVVHAEVPGTLVMLEIVPAYVDRCLRRLGFTAGSSGLTYTRAAAAKRGQA
jgi:hypothetical protein